MRYSSTVCSVSLVMVTSGTSSGAASGAASKAGGGGSGSRSPGTGCWAKAAREKPLSSKKNRKRIAVTSMDWNGRILADVRRHCAAKWKLVRPNYFCYNPPRLKFAPVGNGCVCRAGGWQAQVFDGFNSGAGAHMLAVALLGLGAIEKNTGNPRVIQEERRKIVRGKRCVIDTGIQAAFPAA